MGFTLEDREALCQQGSTVAAAPASGHVFVTVGNGHEIITFLKEVLMPQFYACPMPDESGYSRTLNVNRQNNQPLYATPNSGIYPRRIRRLQIDR
jgi:hypothetical protein